MFNIQVPAVRSLLLGLYIIYSGLRNNINSPSSLYLYTHRQDSSVLKVGIYANFVKMNFLINNPLKIL